jgi:hypothetical protein
MLHTVCDQIHSETANPNSFIFRETKILHTSGAVLKM